MKMKNRLYKFKVIFRKHHMRGVLAGVIGPVEILRHISEERAQAWIDGVKKNCGEWQFYGEPKTERCK